MAREMIKGLVAVPSPGSPVKTSLTVRLGRASRCGVSSCTGGYRRVRGAGFFIFPLPFHNRIDSEDDYGTTTAAARERHKYFCFVFGSFFLFFLFFSRTTFDRFPWVRPTPANVFPFLLFFLLFIVSSFLTS